MSTLSKPIAPEQLAIRAKCFHPAGTFIEFKKEDIEQSIPDRFEEQVRRYPHRLAVKTRSHQLTYDELNKASNRVAHAILAHRGEGQEPVASLLEPTATAMAAILGVLKAGKIYVPLDPAVPTVRNSYIIGDSQSGLILTDDNNISLSRTLVPNESHLMNIDGLEPDLSLSNPGLDIKPDNPCYIIYTSGSTGQPKGVLLSHRNLLYRTMEWVNVVYICPEDRLSLLRSFSVGGSTRDIFGGLLTGGTVLPFDLKREGLVNLASWLVKEEITIYNSVASLFRHFVSTLTGAESFPSVRLIRLGGEPVFGRDVKSYKKHFSNDCIMINMLGLNEAGGPQVYFIDKESPSQDGVVPVGYPSGEGRILLLDDAGNRVGFNQIGEIAVQSQYLSSYWRRPELNEAAFCPGPRGGEERIFRTGDLGRMLPDGCLVHLGRNESHVKIRGYSVEIIEIQEALIELDTVMEAVVTTKETAKGDKVLVAYIVPTSPLPPDVSTLRRALATRLPVYMIPSNFVFMSSLPLTGPGKVDLRALPEPDSTRPELGNPYAPPRTPVEEEVVKIWCDVLGLDLVGVNDHFLDLGGNSLLASQIISRVIKSFQVEVSVRSVLESPTVADMSVIIVQGQVQAANPLDIERLLRDLESLSDEETK